MNIYYVNNSIVLGYFKGKPVTQKRGFCEFCDFLNMYLGFPKGPFIYDISHFRGLPKVVDTKLYFG